jgi:hypothetical protein
VIVSVAPAAIVALLAGKFGDEKSFPTIVVGPGTTGVEGPLATLGSDQANEVKVKTPAPSFLTVKVEATVWPTVELGNCNV